MCCRISKSHTQLWHESKPLYYTRLALFECMAHVLCVCVCTVCWSAESFARALKRRVLNNTAALWHAFAHAMCSCACGSCSLLVLCAESASLDGCKTVKAHTHITRSTNMQPLRNERTRFIRAILKTVQIQTKRPHQLGRNSVNGGKKPPAHMLPKNLLRPAHALKPARQKPL